MSEVWKRRLTIHGLLVGDHLQKLGKRFFESVTPLVAQGKLQAYEHVTRGLEHAPQAFVDMLKEGGALGKPVIIVSAD